MPPLPHEPLENGNHSPGVKPVRGDTRSRFNALVPYYGCKRQAAKAIVEQLGKHHAYWEPFCGSMAVLLSKPPCVMEVANDLNGGLVNLARVIASDELSLALFGRLERTAFCAALHTDSQGWLLGHQGGGMEEQADLDWAYHYFVVSWMGRNGLVGTENGLSSGFCKRMTSNGGDPATRFRNVVANLPRWWERLRGVTILSEDGISLCGRIEDKRGCVIYVDPPYLEKKARYLHDFEPGQHAELAEVLRGFRKTRVVVSYYDAPLLDELYLRHGWSKLSVSVKQNLAVTAGAPKAPEVLLVNQVVLSVGATSVGGSPGSVKLG